MTYNRSCSCGDVMTVEGGTREEAVKNMKMIMTDQAITEHMKQKHPGEKVPSCEQVRTMIEQG
ncbi:MAG TPA: hypothetical protein VF905_08845, partial [Nitrospirota bacterium]